MSFERLDRPTCPDYGNVLISILVLYTCLRSRDCRYSLERGFEFKASFTSGFTSCESYCKLYFNIHILLLEGGQLYNSVIL